MSASEITTEELLDAMLSSYIRRAASNVVAFSDNVAKNGPAYTIAWEGEDLFVSDMLGKHAERVFGIVEQGEHDIVEATRIVVAALTRELLNNVNRPSSTGVFHRAFDLMKADAASRFVRDIGGALERD